jgi:hypothetical protein
MTDDKPKAFDWSGGGTHYGKLSMTALEAKMPAKYFSDGKSDGCIGCQDTIDADDPVCGDCQSFRNCNRRLMDKICKRFQQ